MTDFFLICKVSYDTMTTLSWVQKFFLFLFFFDGLLKMASCYIKKSEKGRGDEVDSSRGSLQNEHINFSILCFHKIDSLNNLLRNVYLK